MINHIAVFDTLAFANKLKAAGVESKAADVQSEATSEILSTLVENKIATKDDIKDLRYELKSFTAWIALTIIGVLGALQTLFHYVK